MGMITEAAEVRFLPEDRAVLEARSRIILLAAEGRSTLSIARMLGTMPRTGSLCRGRFARKGLGRSRQAAIRSSKYGAETARRILEVLDKPPPRDLPAGPGC